MDLSFKKYDMKYTLEFRKRITINTDPQRRCYDGAYLSSEEVWTEWAEVYSSANREGLQDSADTFKRINPTHEYRIALTS